MRGSHLPLPPEAPVPPFWGWVDRTEQDLRPGLEVGPAGRRGTGAITETTQCVSPLRETALQTSPAPGPPNLCARLPAAERTAAAARAIGGQRCSYSPARLGFRRNTSARSRRGSRGSPMLCESPRDAMGASELPLGGWREPARSDLGDGVLEPLHPPFWPLSICTQVVVLCFSVLPLFSLRAHLLSGLNECWSAPVDLWPLCPYNNRLVVLKVWYSDH